MIHIYKTKAYDFNIFRTLGVTKRDMRYITISELLIQTIVIEIVVYVIAILIGAFSYAGNPLVIYKSVSLVASILYFVVMTIFGYLIARRFNKKLFKFSVAKTFKELA
jgi:membrane protein YdbS with pleckstrin-like domain